MVTAMTMAVAAPIRAAIHGALGLFMFLLCLSDEECEDIERWNVVMR